MSKLDKQCPVEQFEAAVSQSAVASSPLKDMKIVKANPEEVEVLAPLPFIENYF